MAQLQLQADDVVAAQQLHGQPPRWRMLAGIAVIGGALCVLFGWRPFNDAPGPLSSAWGPIALLGLVLLLNPVRFVLIPWMARRLYSEQKSLRVASELEWNRHGLTHRSPAASGTLAWEDYLKWKEDDRLFLLYQSSHLFQIIPKRVFASPAEEQDFRRYLPRVGAPLRAS